MPKQEGVLTFFLGANVLFSAAYSKDGRSAALFALASKHGCRLISSNYAVAEAKRNLIAKKPEALPRFLENLKSVGHIPEANKERCEDIAALGLNDADVPVLAAAVGHADIFTTSDRKHFGHWMSQKIKGLKILSLADTLDLLLP